MEKYKFILSLVIICIMVVGVSFYIDNTTIIIYDSNGGSKIDPTTARTPFWKLPPENPTREGYSFVGWEIEEKFTTPLSINSLRELFKTSVWYAKWNINTIESYMRIDASNNYDETGSYIYFGEYPQTIKEADITVGTTIDSDGYFLGSDGGKYYKVVASPHNSGYKFSSGTTIDSGTTYYFKVEPIKWRILEESDGEALVLCESIIANKRYNESINDYAESEIRIWLNNEFYNKSFNTIQQGLILTTSINSNVISAGYNTNPYTCANTDDKIFLLSLAEIVNPNFGFPNTTGFTSTREKIVSDYSRATGAYMSTESNYGNGLWWLRCPGSDSSSDARYVDINGICSSLFYVNNISYGIVPALKIQL